VLTALALAAPIRGLIPALAGEQVLRALTFRRQEVVDVLDLDLAAQIEQEPGGQQLLDRPGRVGHV
jgi:hypothetical protein